MLSFHNHSSANILTNANLSGVVAQLVTARASDRKVAGSMPVLGITSLCPWERHLTLIF